MNILKVIPSLMCPHKCSFCYNKLNNDETLLQINNLKDFLQNNKSKFEKIIITGTEPFSLPKDYFNDIIDTCKNYIDNVYVETYPINILNYRNDVEYILSYDFLNKPYSYEAWANMLKFPKPFDLKIVLSPVLFAQYPNAIFKKFSYCPNLKSVELVPLMKNNMIKIKNINDIVGQYIKLFVSSQLNLKYRNITRENLDKLVKGEELPQDNYYCLMPDGSLAVETFNELTDYLEYTPIETKDIGIIQSEPDKRTVLRPDIIEWKKSNA